MAMARIETILFVDDDPDLREMIAATMAEAGYAVLTAPNGYDAIGVLADDWVTLLITDITMPGIDGFELARQARALRPNIQIIYISGYPIDSPHDAGPVYGAVLKKPLRMGDLLAEVSARLL